MVHISHNIVHHSNYAIRLKHYTSTLSMLYVIWGTTNVSWIQGRVQFQRSGLWFSTVNYVTKVCIGVWDGIIAWYGACQAQD